MTSKLLSNEQEVKYQHVIIEDRPYEAGRLQGEFLKQTGRTLILYEPPEPEQMAQEMRQLYEEHYGGK